MPARGTSPIEFLLLGPIEARLDGSSVDLGGPRQRALLALLLIEVGRVVSADTLADELWATEPPDGAQTTLRSYASRLRAALGPGAGLRGGSGGYALEVPRESIDAHRFETGIREADDALAARSNARAAERAREALSLWRGEPFGGLANDGALRIEADRLAELRLRALEVRIEAEIALGRSDQLTDELEALVRRHPYRERFWRQLMLALYHSERQADALAAFTRARDALESELGLEPGDDLQQLQIAILRHEVPPLADSAIGGRHNLPAQLASFVGRGAELDELARLVDENRLVTLTGVGGVGKTRLALEAAERAVADFADGAWFIDLAPLSEPGLVAQHVARTLQVREAGGDAVTGLVERLRTTETLLVIDNCEHLALACAELSRSILSECARVRILATSRAPLGVPGEVEYSVPPLDLPPEGAPAAELRANESVQLLIARARAARPHVELDDATVESAARICRDLDGLPLAIELAAARAKALSLADIAGRLDDRFRFLVSWRRLSSARHQTLRQAMDWSYELLSTDERQTLCRLSVFVGGFALEAAAQVCVGAGDEATGPPPEAVDLLERLVEASLVIADERAGVVRYRLLETVRQYAASRLAKADEIATRERHAQHFLALAERAEPELTGESQSAWFTTLETEHDNLRSALEYLADGTSPELQLRMTVTLTRFWYVRGYFSEARRWLERAIGRADGQPVQLRRRALTAAAAIALIQGDHSAAIDLAEASLEAARESGEERLVANGLSNLGAIALAAGDNDRARRTLEEAVVLGRNVDDERVLAMALNNLGDWALTVGDLERAEPLFDESLGLLRARGDTANVARSLFNLGAVALRTGRLDEADQRLRESLELSNAAGDKEDVAWGLVGRAALAAQRGGGETAAMLIGAAEALLGQLGATFKPFERQLHVEAVARATELIGDDATAEARQRGSSLSFDDAVEVALRS